MTTGGCLCGTVRFEFEGTPATMTHCHCKMCRKAHGAPFATYADVPEARFRWTAGEDAIVGYESSPRFMRSFCGRCGSVVPDRGTGDEGLVYVPAGCLDGDPGIRPSSHIFTGSKAPWHRIADDLPRNDVYEDGNAGPGTEPGPAGAPPPDTVRGSCLCGAVTFEIRGPLRVVHNCHCERCRKARAAAHTTNGFTAADDLVFLTGEDHVEYFALPGARHFGQSFCRTCGSGVPRKNAERDVATIPFGALDDDPGRGADDHIYVGFKAIWYDIADDLPSFEEGPA